MYLGTNNGFWCDLLGYSCAMKIMQNPSVWFETTSNPRVHSGMEAEGIQGREKAKENKSDFLNSFNLISGVWFDDGGREK